MDIDLTARKLLEVLSDGSMPNGSTVVVWDDGTIAPASTAPELAGGYVVARFPVGYELSREDVIRELIDGLSRHVQV